MQKLTGFLSHRFTVWAILALPALNLVWPVLVGGPVPPHFQTESGEWAMRLLIVTLALTPLQRLFRKSRLVNWFLRRRRYIGVAVFFYGALHVGFYVWDKFVSWGAGALNWILFTATDIHALCGWLAISLLLILALTSNRISQRLMRRWWKRVQRLAYVAALGVAIHWLLLANSPQTWIQLGVLVILEALRIRIDLRNRWGMPLRASGQSVPKPQP